VDRLHAFHDGLRETGYVEGRNLAIEYRWAEGRNDRLPALAAELVRRQVSVIVTAGSTPAALATRAATPTIPIVFYMGANPVEAGLVSSLSRPGGNVTGVVTLNVEVTPKRLELLHELVPTATTIALLVNPATSYAETMTRDLQAAASALGVQLHRRYHSSCNHCHGPDGIGSTFGPALIDLPDVEAFRRIVRDGKSNGISLRCTAPCRQMMC
jgi:putative tryptophan/tyrosine transport system substrate-binding protein